MNAFVVIRNDQTIKQRTDQQLPADKIVCWYHEKDVELMKELDPHFKIFIQRGEQDVFKWHYFGSLTNPPQAPSPDEIPALRELKEEKRQKYQENYDRTMFHLRQAMLFLPCISPDFLSHFTEVVSLDPKLKNLLLELHCPVLPIPLHAVPNLAEMDLLALPKPLAAYPEGHLREAACAQVVETIEEVLLRRYPHIELKSAFPYFLPLPQTPSWSWLGALRSLFQW